MSTSPFVVFGYGSLIFKPPPHVISQVPGFIKGFVRRFALKSYKRWGTPEHPGYAVTITRKEDWDRIGSSDSFPVEDIVWGVALTIDPKHVDEVRDYLTKREKNYAPEILSVYTTEHRVEKVVIPEAHCYVGQLDSSAFDCCVPLDILAMHIWRSVGSAGRNKDYIYQLAESMRTLAPTAHDPYLFALEDKVRKIDMGHAEDALRN